MLIKKHRYCSNKNYFWKTKTIKKLKYLKFAIKLCVFCKILFKIIIFQA